MLSKGFTERQWWLSITAAWALLLGLPTAYNTIGENLPGSFWFDIHKLEVSDAFTEDGRRIVDYKRSVYRKFPGRWRTVEEFETPLGFTALRACEGEHNYKLDNALPDPTTLRWLTGKISHQDRLLGVRDKCKWEAPYNFSRELPDGRYRVCVTVYPMTQWGEKWVSECSNVYHEPVVYK